MKDSVGMQAEGKGLAHPSLVGAMSKKAGILGCGKEALKDFKVGFVWWDLYLLLETFHAHVCALDCTPFVSLRAIFTRVCLCNRGSVVFSCSSKQVPPFKVSSQFTLFSIVAVLVCIPTNSVVKHFKVSLPQ